MSGSFAYDPEDTSYTIEDIPGGSKISADVSYPSYYLHDGWTSNSTIVKATTEKNNLATELEQFGEVTKGSAYWYSDYNSNNVTTIYYFVAPVTGYAHYVSDDVVVYSSDEGITIDALDKDENLTVHLTEKDVHKVTTTDIGDKGTYSFTLPEGSYQVGSDIYIHNSDDFDVLITPNTGWTVTYWNIKPTNSPQQEIKATSLRYVIPNVTEDFILTPIFAATSYNTISWPTISEDQNFLTLSEYNCVSSVSSGASFSFKLSGAGLSLLENVYANGVTFVPEENGGNYTYTGDGADRIYTIKNIVENHSITVSFCEVGISVNGIDVSALNGSGWYYDASQQILVLQKSNLTVSGANDADIAAQFSISLEAESLTLDDFVLNSNSSRSALLYALGSDTVITLSGTNVLNHSAASTSITALDGNLTLRGNGNITLKGSNIAQYEIITNYALNITGRSIVNIEGCNGDVSSYMIYADDLNVKGTAVLDIEASDNCDYAVCAYYITIGSEDMSDSPVVRINGAYRGINLYYDLVVYSGDFAVSGKYCALRTRYGDIYNYGGITELSVTSSSGGIIDGYYFYNNEWKVGYHVGYSVTYIDENGTSKYVAPVTKSQYSDYSYDLFAETSIFYGMQTDVCQDSNIDEFRQIRVMPISSDWDDMTLSVVVDGKVYSSAINMNRHNYGYYYINDANGNELPYGTGWQINMGSNSACSAVQETADLSTNGNGYLQVTRFSADAKLNPAEITFDKSNGYDNVLGLEDAVIEVTEPIEDGTIRTFDHAVQGTTDATGRIVLIDEEKNETEWVLGTDYTWTRSTNVYETNKLEINYSTLSALDLGNYTIRVFYYDDDINDTTYYYSDISLTVTDTTRISGSLNMTPIEPKIGKGESVTFETDYIGTDPMAYEWILEGNTSENTVITVDNGSAVLTIAEDEAIGNNITVTVKSYADEAMTKEIGFVIATVNVIAKATDIDITCVGESPSDDDSYTLHHTTENGEPRTWQFNADIIMDEGIAETENVTWSLWAIN